MPAHNRKKGRKRPLRDPNAGAMYVVGADQNFDLLFSARLQAAANPRSVQSYSSRHNILIVGDGDLTFSLSLATALGGQNLVATTFDSKHALYRKYQGVKSTIQSLRRVGCNVLHGVDATKLTSTTELDDFVGTFHRIVFNFPHIGGATQEDVRANQLLLREYFQQSLPFLHPSGGEAHVTLRSTTFYDSWDVVGQAEKAGMRLVRMEKFDSKQLLSYENKRTSGESTMRQAPSIENAKRYRFVRNHRVRNQGLSLSSSSSSSTSTSPPPPNSYNINKRQKVSLPIKKVEQKVDQKPKQTASTTKPSSVEPTNSKFKKEKKKNKKKKKKNRLSLFQKKEDHRVQTRMKQTQ
jgi:25S rRNA (uracil2634-N3)-methyltransferase